MLFALIVFLMSNAVAADNSGVNDAAINKADISQNRHYTDQLCAKVKQCELGKLIAADLPPFMQDFIVQTVDSQCVVIASSYETQIIDAKLEDEAKSCVHSLENQSCEKLLATKGEANTKQCNDFLKLAESAGIDFSKIQF